MGRFARVFDVVRDLFPPAEGPPHYPTEVSGDVVFVHQLIRGTERLREFQSTTVSGAAGVALVDSVPAPNDRLWYVLSCHMFHNDSTARHSMIYVVDPGGGPGCYTFYESLPQSLRMAAPRAIIVPPRHILRGTTTALTAGKILTLEFLFLELRMGEPIPVS